MTFTRTAMLAVLLASYAIPAGAQAVKLEFHDGKVNLTAQNASLRAVLAEWARLGGTQVVNADRLAGPPLTLQLTDVPETQALDIVLRGTAGYIAGQRAISDPVGSRSALDRILVIPTAGTAPAVSARPVVAPPPFAVPAFRPPPVDPDDDPVSDVPPDDDPPNRGRNGGPPNLTRPNIAQPPQQTFEPEENEQPDEPAENPNTGVPVNPFGIQTGSSRPGTITPVPQPQAPRPQPDPEP